MNKSSNLLIILAIAVQLLSLSLVSCTGGPGSSPSPPPSLASILVTPDEAVIISGSTKQFKAAGYLSDGTSEDLSSSVTWSSSNSAVATINDQGLVTSSATGTTLITATSSVVTGSKVGSVLLAVTVRTHIPATGQTTSYFSGDDGNLQKGIARPIPRFTTNGNGTITDELTGLMWLQEGNCIETKYPGYDNDTVAGDGMVVWQHALDFASYINQGVYPNCAAGYSDWRIPNINEIKSLATSGRGSSAWLDAQGFINIQPGNYWSSTSSLTSDRALVFPMYAAANVIDDDYKTSGRYTMFVRDGSSGVIRLPRTGQTTCYDSAGTQISCLNTLQDGDLQKGVLMPNPRFTNPDGTSPLNSNLAVDQLTGLTWTKNANTPGPAACLPGTTKTWQDALRYIDCLNTNSYEGYSDWRLPNINEYQTLLNMEDAQWLALQGFDIQWGYFSSSTPISSTEVLSIQPAWKIVSILQQSFPTRVWPVRGGQ